MISIFKGFFLRCLLYNPSYDPNVCVKQHVGSCERLSSKMEEINHAKTAVQKRSASLSDRLIV